MTPEERAAFVDGIPDPPRHFNKLGQPISLREWGELVEDPSDYKRIAGTTVGEFWISTVWLGLDHSHSFGTAPPLIFETMVFHAGSMDPWDDMEMRRYSTEDQARQGHEEMVQLVETLEGVGRKEAES